MEQATKELLRKLVDEYTDDGDSLDALVQWRYRANVVWWLRQGRERGDEIATLEGDEDFSLSVDENGLVWLLTGLGFAQRERLVDYKELRGDP